MRGTGEGEQWRAADTVPGPEKVQIFSVCLWEERKPQQRKQQQMIICSSFVLSSLSLSIFSSLTLSDSIHTRGLRCSFTAGSRWRDASLEKNISPAVFIYYSYFSLYRWHSTYTLRSLLQFIRPLTSTVYKAPVWMSRKHCMQQGKQPSYCVEDEDEDAAAENKICLYIL